MAGHRGELGAWDEPAPASERDELVGERLPSLKGVHDAHCFNLRSKSHEEYYGELRDSPSERWSRRWTAWNPPSSAAALYAYRLCKERARTGATQVEAAAAGRISVSLFGHYETMRRIPTMDASVRFDAFFGLPEYFSDLQPLVVNEVGAVSGTMGSYLEFIEQEAQASSLRFYQPQLIPGLFQSEPYARAVLSRGTRANRLEQALATRMGRQQILLRDDPPFIVAVIRERALSEIVGGTGIMRGQLTRLLELSAQPTTYIHVIPNGAPRHVSTEFILLKYAEGDDLAYVEAAGALGRATARTADLHRLENLFDQVRSSAGSEEESIRLIQNAMDSLEARCATGANTCHSADTAPGRPWRRRWRRPE